MKEILKKIIFDKQKQIFRRISIECLKMGLHLKVHSDRRNAQSWTLWNSTTDHPGLLQQHNPPP